MRAASLRTCCKSTTLATQILSGKLLSTDHNKDIEINVARRLLYMLFTTLYNLTKFFLISAKVQRADLMCHMIRNSLGL